MISRRKLSANRANARASTGPRTAAGKARAARNALRHGLRSPISADAALSAEVETLAGQIAGEGASQEQRELAARVAEAQIDLTRVRRARRDLLARLHSENGYQSKVDLGQKKFKLLKHLAETIGWGARIPDEYQDLFRLLYGPDKSAVILTDLSAELSVMDRYERRALSRRKFAIRALDAARAAPT